MRLTLLTIMAMLCSSVNAKSNFAIGKYSGTGTEFNHVVTGLDLSNNDGLVLIKPPVTSGFLWLDTLRGPGSTLDSTQKTRASSVTGFTEFKNDGFQIGGTSSQLNSAGANYEYLSFSEKTGFLDIVTYTGDHSASRAIPHNLGDNVGLIIIKSIDGDHGGVVWHKALSSADEINTAWMFGDGDKDPSNQYAYVWGDKEPTSNEFYVGASWTTNGQGNQYVAYVFADNPVSTSPKLRQT